MHRRLHIVLAATSLLALAALIPAETRAAGDGLAFIESAHNGDRGVNGLKGAQSLALSPDESQLYVASSGDSAVAVFRRDGGTGRLSFVENEQQGVAGVQGLGGAGAVVVSPDGANVYAAGTLDNAIVIFARDAATGGLRYVDMTRENVNGVTGIAGVNALAMSPDGATLYAAAPGDNALAVFQRDPASGALTPLEVQRDGAGPVRGLRTPQVVVVTRDGAQVYVAGGSDVAVFSRNATTGALTFVESQGNAANGVAGLGGASWLALSADGTSVYVAGKVDDGLAVFRRDPATGALTFVEEIMQGIGGADGLDGVGTVTVSPDGHHVYATASSSTSIVKTVAVFRRDPATGALTYVGKQADGVGNVSGLSGAAAALMSGDGVYLYVAGKSANEVAVFSALCGDGILDLGEQCDDGNAVDGDGCSAGCRHECVTHTDCVDDDRCTEGRCRSGECDFPRCGLTGGICELTDAIDTAVPALETAAA